MCSFLQDARLKENLIGCTKSFNVPAIPVCCAVVTMVELWNASHVPANLALQWSRRLPKRFLGGDNRPGINSQFSGSYWLSDIHAHLCCVWRNSAFRKDVTFFIDTDINSRKYYYGESFISLKKICEDRNYTYKHALWPDISRN